MATIKQKLAFKEITENNRPVSPVMKEVGYAKSSTTKPSILTNSKGWKELMEQHLPDKLLARKHKEGLEASRKLVIGEEVIKEPDYQTRHKYLDSAYKLKGRYVNEEQGGNKTLIINIAGETNQRYEISSVTKPSSE